MLKCNVLFRRSVIGKVYGEQFILINIIRITVILLYTHISLIPHEGVYFLPIVTFEK
jgi:hypothetical protein